ncbi:MAG: ATP-binding protein [Caulobacteraceae bacterium]
MEGIDAAPPLDIEFLIRDYLLVVLNFDQHLRLVFSAASLAGQEAPTAPYAVGSAFETIFGGEALADAAEQARNALVGRGGQAEMSLAGPQGPVVLRLSFMARAAMGRPRGLVVVAENITARRAELARLAALEDRLRAILDNIADGIVVIDAAGRIEGLNHAAARIAGRSAEALIGLRVSELMGEPYRSAHQSHIQRYLETGESGILNVGPRRLPMLDADGRTVPVELSVGEAWIGGQRKFIGLFRDLTRTLRQEGALLDANAELTARIAELEAASVDLEAQKLGLERLAAATEKAREAAEEANRAKSRFVATVSHELRTPLNGILAVSDMLSRRNLDGETREMAEIIQRSGRSLLALLDDILDMARVEAGLLQVSARPFRPIEVLQGVADIWRVPAQSKSVRLRLDVAELPDQLSGDPDRLRQILSNLINNALKFTDGEEVALTARGEASGPGACRVRFSVTDQGPGIPPAMREKIFEPFVQVENGDARRHQGSGLGLAICRELTTLMGGHVWAEPHGERGTAMNLEIEFPLAEAPGAAAGAAAGPAAPFRLPADIDLLVAEDHPANRQVMALILREAGWGAEFAHDGREALDKAAGGQFDAILMDLQMPRMDGLTATRAIRALAGEAGSIPIIGVTASASAEELDRAREAGMDAVVTKPIDPARLLEVVARCITADRRPTDRRRQAGTRRRRRGSQ